MEATHEGGPVGRGAPLAEPVGAGEPAGVEASEVLPVDVAVGSLGLGPCVPGVVLDGARSGVAVHAVRLSAIPTTQDSAPLRDRRLASELGRRRRSGIPSP
jgi:hypothetical protein